MTANDTLIEALDGARDWTLLLIADVVGDEWTYQPKIGAQHILWLCGHLASAQQTLILVRCLGGEKTDIAFNSHFPIGESVKNATEHCYPAPDVILQKMADTHATVLDGVARMTDAELAEPCSGKDGAVHPHYTTKRGAINHCARHEAFHAGQIALLRRMQGKSFLR